MLFLPFPNPLHCPEPLPHGDHLSQPWDGCVSGQPFSHVMDCVIVPAAVNQRGNLRTAAARSRVTWVCPEGLSWACACRPQWGWSPLPSMYLRALPPRAPTPSLGSGADISCVGPGAPKPPLASTTSVCPQGLWFLLSPRRRRPAQTCPASLRISQGQPHFPSRFSSHLLFQQNSDLAGA